MSRRGRRATEKSRESTRRMHEAAWLERVVGPVWNSVSGFPTISRETPVRSNETGVCMTKGLIPAALVAALLLASCAAAPEEVPEPSPSPVIEFAAGSEPIWETDPEKFTVPPGPSARVIGETVLIGEEYSGTVQAFDARTGDPKWKLEPFSGRIGSANARSLPLVTSPAQGGLVIAGYSQDCWIGPRCTGVPKGTSAVVGVAAISVASGKPVWQTILAKAGPEGSATEYDGIALEATAADADADAVLVHLGTHDGKPTEGGTPGATAVLLDAATGAERWRLKDFVSKHLTDSLVLGVPISKPAERQGSMMRGPWITGAADRKLGVTLDLADEVPWSMSGAEISLEGAGGPGLITTLEMSPPPDTGNLMLIGPDGKKIPSIVDDLKWALTECAKVEVLACVINGRNATEKLLTWLPGEDTPTTAELWDGNLQPWALAGDTVLITENGYVAVNTTGTRASWVAADRQGKILGERRPGAAIAASEKYVVTQNLVPVEDDQTYPLALQVWQITDLPG